MDKPLFRQQALDALTLRMEGEVLLRHPLRYRLLAWISILLVACFALTLHYTRIDQKFSINGYTLRNETGAESSPVVLRVPVGKIGWIRPQQRLMLALSAGPGQSAISVPAGVERIGTEVEISAGGAKEDIGPYVSVYARIYRDDAHVAGRPLMLGEGVPVSVDVPAGRVSILQYLMGEQADQGMPQHTQKQTTEQTP